MALHVRGPERKSIKLEQGEQERSEKLRLER